MDCVDDKGNTFIGYTAQLNWKTIYLTYSRILINRDNQKSFEKSTLSKLKSPYFKKNDLIWEPSYLIEKGRWNHSEESFAEMLLERKDGFINWNCTQPKAEAHVKVSEGVVIKGLGHTEFLEMNIHPWSMPYDTMRWGRFVSKTDTIVWLQFRGPKNLDLFYHNGVLIENSHFYNDEVRLDHGKAVLSITESIELRSGRLNKTVLKDDPIFKSILPERVQYAKESKWKSKAMFEREDGKIVTGWIIHDFVKWG